jgi:hypothetical protein
MGSLSLIIIWYIVFCTNNLNLIIGSYMSDYKACQFGSGILTRNDNDVMDLNTLLTKVTTKIYYLFFKI